MKEKCEVTVTFSFTDDEMKKLNHAVKIMQENGEPDYSLIAEIKNIVWMALKDDVFTMTSLSE